MDDKEIVVKLREAADRIHADRSVYDMMLEEMDKKAKEAAELDKAFREKFPPGVGNPDWEEFQDLCRAFFLEGNEEVLRG